MEAPATLICAAWLGVMAAVCPAMASAQSQPSLEMFDPEAEMRGIAMTREACAALEEQQTAVWVEAMGQTACLRYYASGLKPAPGPNPIAAAWLHGDIMGPTGHGAEKHQKGLGVAAMIEQERHLSERFGVPFIFLARPGAYGSSGSHFKMRGRPVEAALMLQMLDALKVRYGIGAWALGGHSGGGTLVSEMLARRSDIRCAVISSGASEFRAHLEAHHYAAALAHPENWFDPSASLDRIPADPARRIFVIGDPRDDNAIFANQRLYYDGLIARGHAAWLVPLECAPGPEHHDLMDFAETAAGLCAEGVSAPEIIATLKAMPDPPPRISN